MSLFSQPIALMKAHRPLRMRPVYSIVSVPLERRGLTSITRQAKILRVPAPPSLRMSRFHNCVLRCLRFKVVLVDTSVLRRLACRLVSIPIVTRVLAPPLSHAVPFPISPQPRPCPSRLTPHPQPAPLHCRCRLRWKRLLQVPLRAATATVSVIKSYHIKVRRRKVRVMSAMPLVLTAVAVIID